MVKPLTRGEKTRKWSVALTATNGQVKMNPKSPLNLGAWRSAMISVVSSAIVLIRKTKCRRPSGLSAVPTWARSCTKWSAGIQTEKITTAIYIICAPK